MKANLSGLILCLGVLPSCAGVAFYEDEGLSKRTGIPVYRPAPHLLVRHSAGKEPSVTTEVLMLPDKSDPFYVYPHTGLGTANAQLTLSSGVLASFQGATDSKVPELVNAFANLAKELAGGFAGIYGAVKPPEAAEEQAIDTAKAKAAALHLRQAQKYLEAIVKEDTLPASASPSKDLARDASAEISQWISKLDDPVAILDMDSNDVRKSILELAKRLEAGKIDVRSGTDPMLVLINLAADNFKSALGFLNLAADTLSPPPIAPTRVELYRIELNEVGKTKLVRVPLP